MFCAVCGEEVPEPSLLAAGGLGKDWWTVADCASTAVKLDEEVEADRVDSRALPTQERTVRMVHLSSYWSR